MKKSNLNKKLPAVTVTIASYNSRRTIEKCLKSIKKQTYPNIDIVVVDSLFYDSKEREKCKKIIKRYARYFQDGPERSIQRNRGIKEGKGKYVLILDQDMCLRPKVVEECVLTMEESKNIALVIPEISIGKGFWTKSVALERYVSTYLEEGMNECCRFFRKSDALKIGGYDEDIVGVEDSDFHYRMKKRGGVGKVKEFIYHDEGKTNFFSRVKKKYYYSRAFRKYLKRYPYIATTQFFPIKRAYIKHIGILIKHPFLTLGFISLRIAEVSAGFLGLVSKK